MGWARGVLSQLFHIVKGFPSYYIYKFNNAITFKLKSISLFLVSYNFLEKDGTGLFFQINIACSVFTGLINWRGLHFSDY